MTADPTAVGRGVVCRVKAAGGSIVYTTRRMTLDEALEVAEQVRMDVKTATPENPFVLFPATSYEDLALRGDKITAVEVLRVDGGCGPVPR